MAHKTTGTWTNKNLQPYRQEGDKLGDEAIKMIIDAGLESKVNEVFAMIETNKGVEDLNLPQEAKDYFTPGKDLPEWADQKKILAGERLFAVYGFQITSLLLFKSLPMAYACAQGAKVLTSTGRLTEKNGQLKVFTKRLMKTAQMVIDVCEPGGMSPDGKGFVSVRKVRLIHASIRYYLEKYHWDAEAYGRPLCQEDLAGTQQSFSACILEGLEQMKIHVTPEEKEGFMHLWRLVGHLIGLDEKLNVDTYEEGLDLGYSIFNHQQATSQDGKDLAKALNDFLMDVIPFTFFDTLPASFIRLYSGDEIADMLGLKKERNIIARWLFIIVSLTWKVKHRIERIIPPFRWLSGKFNVWFLSFMIKRFNKFQEVHFSIPSSLQGPSTTDHSAKFEAEIKH